MNVKNFNPFERHVEKITLAVAAAGAAYLIWLAYPPMLTIDTPAGPVEAGAVEPAISAAVQQLEQARDSTVRLGEIKIKLPDLVGGYERAMMSSPLNEDLVRAPVPQIGPLNVAVADIDQGTQVAELPVATPTVPPPVELSAKTWMGRVLYTPKPPAGVIAPAPANPGGAPTGVLADVRLNMIRGTIDRGAMLAEMKDAAIPADQQIPPQLQLAAVCRIEVQRREQTAAGWQDWVAVAPDKDLPGPPDLTWDSGDEDIIPNLTTLTQHAVEITQPSYFLLPTGQTVVQDIDSENKPAAAPGTAAPAPAVEAAPPPITPNPRGPAPVSRWTPGRGSGQRGPAGMPPPAMAPQGPTLMPAEQGADKVPFWFFDDSVKAGHTYEYQVRVVMYNPTYRLPHKLKDPSMKLMPTIASAWTSVPGAVSVEGDMYVYVTGAAGGGGANPQQRIGVRIYKWNAGYWYSHEISTEPGMEIATKMNLGDAKAETVVNTGLTMVDLRDNNDVVVLQDAEGALETRDYRIDVKDEHRKKLDEEVEKRLAAIAATQPAATRPAPTVVAPPIAPPPSQPPTPPSGGSRWSPGRSAGGR